MGEICYDPAYKPQCQGGVRVMYRWEVAPNHLLKVDNTLQSALVLRSGCVAPEGDGGCEDLTQ